ncbi:hypothetical protein [Streptomyces sp. NPDC091371]|uniref:hypothetical protein n=1 Tax=Streptomyces sp. NPDC091371 TaxID=3155303 RepID=UPI00343C3AA2
MRTPGRRGAGLRFEAGEPHHRVRGLHQAARFPLRGNVGVGEHCVQDLLDLVQHRLTDRLPGLGGQSARRTCKAPDHHMLVMRQLPQLPRVQRPVRCA